VDSARAGSQAGIAGPPHEGSPEDVVAWLFRAHGLALIRVALLLVGDQATAEDVVQDAFLGLHRALPRLQDTNRALGYLRVSVVNGCRSVGRSRRRAQLIRVEHDPPVWSAESAVMAEEDRRTLRGAAETVSPEAAQDLGERIRQRTGRAQHTANRRRRVMAPIAAAVAVMVRHQRKLRTCARTGMVSVGHRQRRQCS
jgi:hypothetical protein